MEMILDLDKRTLRYSLNNKDQGVAFKNIPVSGGLFGTSKIGYIATISMNHASGPIEIILYSNGGGDKEDVKYNDYEELKDRNKTLSQQNDELRSEIRRR